MFLTELQEKLSAVQAERGNVPLSSAHVMHEHAVLVAHNDHTSDEVENPRVRAGNVSASLEERLAATSSPDDPVTLTAEELAQLLEFKAEALASANKTQPIDAKLEGVANARAQEEVDALKAHEDNQAALAQDAAKREAARAEVTRANAVEGEKPETLQE